MSFASFEHDESKKRYSVECDGGREIDIERMTILIEYMRMRNSNALKADLDGYVDV